MSAKILKFKKSSPDSEDELLDALHMLRKAKKKENLENAIIIMKEKDDPNPYCYMTGDFTMSLGLIHRVQAFYSYLFLKDNDSGP